LTALLLRPGKAGAEYCDKFVCLYVCVSMCVSVCPRAYLFNRWTDLHGADPLWPWLGPPLAALQYVMYFRCWTSLFTIAGRKWMMSRLAVMGCMALRGDIGADSDVYERLVWICMTLTDIKEQSKSLSKVAYIHTHIRRWNGAWKKVVRSENNFNVCRRLPTTDGKTALKFFCILSCNLHASFSEMLN